MFHDRFLDWYTMAQMAAQDYFSRLQMSGMMHPDLANLSALGNLASFSNANNSMNTSSSSSKNNLKRKDKMADSYDMKKSSSKDSMHQSKSSNYSQSFPSTSNLQKDFMAMAAAAAAQLNTSHDNSLNDSKSNSKSSMQNNYVPSRNSNMNSSPMRANSNSSSSRKKDTDKKYDNSGKVGRFSFICMLIANFPSQIIIIHPNEVILGTTIKIIIRT